MLTVHTPFQPYELNPVKTSRLTDIPLQELLNITLKTKMVLLRGFQQLDRDALLSWCRSQARLLSWDFGPVMEMKVDKNTKNYLFTEGDVPLHWDGAFYQEPRFLFFHCIQAPEAGSGGETLFVNTEQVWRDASEKEQAKWRGHQLRFATEKLAHYGGHIVRDLVNRHPDSGQIMLRFAEPVGENYLNPVTVTVLNQPALASARILAELSARMRQPAYCYQHQWQEGDYLIADNFSLLHGRHAFRKTTPRHLRRIQIL